MLVVSPAKVKIIYLQFMIVYVIQILFRCTDRHNGLTDLPKLEISLAYSIQPFLMFTICLVFHKMGMICLVSLVTQATQVSQSDESFRSFSQVSQ